MEQTRSSGAYPGYGEGSSNREAHSSGVSWGAVIAGAFVTAALSLTLLALGAGFGLLSVSPWSSAGATASAIGTAAIIWLIVIQILASGFGGYIAGRLRTKWVAIHTHEVYFRDTAHGFLVWAVAVVVTAAFLGPAATAMVGAAAASEKTAGSENAYFVDMLFRPVPAASATTSTGLEVSTRNTALRTEVGNVLQHAIWGKDTGADQSYLAHLVSLGTGLSPTDAAQRVSDVITQAKQTADAARKATARFLLWTFLALLIGAFCASYAATIGGRQRDHMPAL